MWHFFILNIHFLFPKSAVRERTHLAVQAQSAFSQYGEVLRAQPLTCSDSRKHQPELRRALEKLGERNLLSNINPFDRNKTNQRFSDDTVESIVKACYDMGSVCTGALIVVEQEIQLTEYEMTGIELDCKVSAQVLINIFEHNTPLHDGAVIIRGDRITSATCYLPLSDNMSISKDLGTRHRAALGMSEVCDALVIAVSEETGLVSVASGGSLSRGVTEEELRKRLSQIQYRNSEPRKFTIRKGWRRS